jgi:hypothetical protein
MSDTDAPAEPRDESHAIDEVVERLADRFPTLERSHVEEIVQDEWHRLDEGRVRDFVPVLVEHDARKRLRREFREADHSSGNGDRNGNGSAAGNGDG